MNMTIFINLKTDYDKISILIFKAYLREYLIKLKLNI